MNPIKKKVVVVSVCLACFFLISYSQNYSTIHPSPNIGWSLAGVKQFNNLYTGTTGLSIPVCDVKIGELTQPITLNYFNKAIQVDQLPSWVGLGWNLNAGGQISRVVNGKPDELRDTRSNTLTYTFLYYGSFLYSTTSNFQSPTDNDYSYYANRTLLANNNWNTSGYLYNTLNNLPFVESDPNVFIVVDQGYGTTSQSASPIVYFGTHDFEPDEFIFKIGDISGKFYLNENGLANDPQNWICETQAGNFKIEPTYINNVNKGGIISRMIDRFVLTASDGTKYIFGSNSSNPLQNLEFWRAPLGNGPDNTAQMWGTIDLDIVPDVWHLTRIETPDNHFADFEYENGLPQVTYTDAPFGDGNSSGYSLSLLGYMHLSLSEPKYLKKISTSEGTIIDFLSSTSNQLSSDWALEDPLVRNKHSSFRNYIDLTTLVLTENNNLRKLNSINVSMGSGLIKTFKFDYIENLSERLKLSAFYETSTSSTNFTNKYQFQYNSGLLPAYGTGKVDHFGFFNNKRFFDQPHPGITTRSAFEAAYYDSREPDFNYAIHETLEKVFFPTGGYREYQYEQNEYRSKITRWPFDISQLSNNIPTGGIRIKKIIDYTSTGNIATSKEFVYTQDINSTISSGVLGIPTPQYSWDKTSGGYYFTTRSFIPFDRNESHIAYSTVFEKALDGSYTKHEFKNFDNGQNDEQGFYDISQPPFVDLLPYANHSFRRGQLKRLTLFNSSNQTVKKIDYEYQDGIDNFARYVRAVRLKHGDVGTGYRVSAYPKYYFPNPVRKQIEQTIPEGSSNSLITQVENTFDANNNITTQETTNSKSELNRVVYKYPYDFPGIYPYTEMVNRNIKSPVVQMIQTNVTLNREISNTKTNYQTWNTPLFIKPETTQKSNGGNQLETEATINSYDNKGNVLQTTLRNGLVTSYIYGYNQQYIVATVIGMDYANAISQSGILLSVLNDLNTSDAAMRTELNKLRQLPNCFATTYTIKPLVGKTSETDPNGVTTFYEYDEFGRLNKILDVQHNIIKSYEYHFKN